MRISLVTPSFNQSPYLEACMRSILDQGYPDLEYFVMDGGSTDGSVEIIRRYEGRLTAWRSHPDGGHMDAVQDGFSRSSGEIMGWLNSDDMLAPWALRTIADIFSVFPEVQWITTRYPLLMDHRGILIGSRRNEGFNAKAFFRGRNTTLNPLFYSSFIQQESTFWRRSLWEKAGAGVDTSLRVAGDFELWSRFFRHAELFLVSAPLGIFRFQEEAFTAREMGAYLDVCRRVLHTTGERMPSTIECRLRRIIRLLPPQVIRRLPISFPARMIYHSGRNGKWCMTTEWFA